jgi:hypothetical protein
MRWNEGLYSRMEWGISVLLNEDKIGIKML